MNRLIRFALLGALVTASACEDALEVQNPNSGDKKKVLSTPNDAEALIGSYYKRWVSGVYGGGVEGRLNVWSFMNFSSLANNCQNTSYPFASNNINNTPGNTCGGEHNSQYFGLGEVVRVSSDFIGKLDGIGGDTLDLGSQARNNRARSFAEMLRGMSLGYLALIYDSVSVVKIGQGEFDAGNLVGYQEALDSGYASLARAISIAQDSASFDVVKGGLNGFPFPNTWIHTDNLITWNQNEFVKFIRSHRARIRANMPRTQAERLAVDWTAVINDVDSGMTRDFIIRTSDTEAGAFSRGSLGWRQQYNSYTTWHQMPPFIIGMADTSGSYSDWLAQPLGERGATAGFFMITHDLRFPQGTTRSAQNSDVTLANASPVGNLRAKRYFYNRPAGDDQLSGQGWGLSNYGFIRHRSWAQATGGVARDGRTTLLTMEEMQLLKAEGLYNQGNFAGARDIVNVTRTRGMGCQNNNGTGFPGTTGCTAAQQVAWGGGLPAITAADAVTPVPGTLKTCIPKVPAAPAFNGAVCGNLWEALKYEKRIETAYMHWLGWYLDSRGWGDLAKGTPLFLPVPFQDWLARGKPQNLIYHTGEGAGTAANSAMPTIGTYGW